ncbi:conserved Plasmodium protein, unknown function [Plasmodium knowlesi strain H]|uniref:Uncharacterized protein n=3 Tax=Plasmodium knowlesi TaxID=5850 RepID=A0A5K1U3L0_PLAKH|nr:conserved protein, unknown function [Plasmodium knowlesi strain H]OTN64230.1 Uncharacterized protein PKNOH_S140262100 [Plasmodium knowlesi]CAA9991036.1 conserved protein, unknown function [Plasmodium knowlesi strain H]SBO20682.1 conserved Plasmodium protein, unknown function [Plasmodium knowlesi strain H]SBO21113.1 conserved Plasmodium protein, unknown function [Plasmodium knowlesi strain H]VVS80510.1 conserved protein, unknown function [Plasmodium knowlesi strain H]|eukprot:XP_002262318.1 hypothetical protein, conserved in Plasmodium species [Plasmodium knowlesi strain H]
MIPQLLQKRAIFHTVLSAHGRTPYAECVSKSKRTLCELFKRHFGVSGSYGYSIFSKEGNCDSNVGKNNLHQYEEKNMGNNFLKKKNFYFTKWPGSVSKLGASYFFGKKYNMGFYHLLIEEEGKIKKDIALISSCNAKSVQNKKIENKMKDLSCGYSVQIVLSGKGVKCYYEDVSYTPFRPTYRGNTKQYYTFKNSPTSEVQGMENKNTEGGVEENESSEVSNSPGGKEKDKWYKTKTVKKLFVRLGIGTKNIDITRVLTMHKRYVSIDVDRTGTIINVHGFNKKYVGSVSHRLYRIVRMNVYTMKGGYVYMHKPKQKVSKKK